MKREKKETAKLNKSNKKIERKNSKNEASTAKAEVPYTEKKVSQYVLIFIIGESPMAEQYAELCASYGYNVCICWNEPPLHKSEFNSPSIKVVKSIPADVSVALELTNTDFNLKRKNLEAIDRVIPVTAPIISSSITVTATEQCSWISGKHRLVGISALPSLIEKPLVEVAPTIYTPKETVEVAQRLFNSIGKQIEIVQDRIGMVFPRILCQVINEAAFAITEDIAPPQDIDKVLKNGVNFPFGPIEWAERIGLKQVYAVLKSLHADTQEERYRVAPIIKQFAITGEWWKSEKN